MPAGVSPSVYSVISSWLVAESSSTLRTNFSVRIQDAETPVRTGSLSPSSRNGREFPKVPTPVYTCNAPLRRLRLTPHVLSAVRASVRFVRVERAGACIVLFE